MRFKRGTNSRTVRTRTLSGVFHRALTDLRKLWKTLGQGLDSRTQKFSSKFGQAFGDGVEERNRPEVLRTLRGLTRLA